MADKKKFNEKHQRNLRNDHSRMSNHGEKSSRHDIVNRSDIAPPKDKVVSDVKSKFKKKQGIKRYAEHSKESKDAGLASKEISNNASTESSTNNDLLQVNSSDDLEAPDQQSTISEESFSRLDSSSSKVIDDRQNLKAKSKKTTRKKYYHSRQNKSRQESVGSHRLEKNEVKRRQKQSFKHSESGKKEHVKSASTRNIKAIDLASVSKATFDNNSNSVSKTLVGPDKKKVKERRSQKKKIVTDFEKAQKTKQLNQMPSKRSKLYHTGKNVHQKVVYTSHKVDQFEERKESDENVAIMAADDSVELLRNRANLGSKKRQSKLKFEKTSNNHEANIKNVKGKKYSGTKAQVNKSSRKIQKKNIKRSYSKKLNPQVVDVKSRLKYTVKKIRDWGIGALKKIGIYMLGPLCFFVIVVVMLLSLVQAFSSGVSTVISTSYQSSDVDISNSHLIYTGLEADLKYAIEHVEDDYPSYDEYRYDLDTIGHDMHLLMAYLTAKFGDFSPSNVRSELNSIFNTQYDYKLTRVVEVRYRTVWHSSTDPETGATHTWSTQEPYDWFVLEVTLETKNLENILLSRMDDEQKELYDVLVETKGNFMSMPSPFSESWKSSISSHFGYRLDPVSGQVTFHQGIDIAKPIGTNLLSIIEGIVSEVGYDDDGYGHYVVVKTSTDETILYGHCSSILVNEQDEVEVGETIALVGSSGKSTGPHVHLEIRDSSGNKLNPYFYLTEE